MHCAHVWSDRLAYRMPDGPHQCCEKYYASGQLLKGHDMVKCEIETGQEVRAAIAIPSGHRWVTGFVDAIRPQPNGKHRLDIVGWDGTVYRNCALESIRVVMS